MDLDVFSARPDRAAVASGHFGQARGLNRRDWKEAIGLVLRTTSSPVRFSRSRPLACRLRLLHPLVQRLRRAAKNLAEAETNLRPPTDAHICDPAGESLLPTAAAPILTGHELGESAE